MRQLVTALLLLLTATAGAQTFDTAAATGAQTADTSMLNDVMHRFYDGCMLMRKAISTGNTVTMARAAAKLNEDDLLSDYLPLSDLRYTSLSGAEAPMEGHTVFSGKYAEWWTSERTEAFNDSVADGAREGSGTCFVMRKAVKAGQHLAFDIEQQGECVFLLIAEGDSQLQLSATTATTGVPVNVSDDGAVSIATCSVPGKQVYTFHITITNHSPHDASFAFATN